MENEDFKVTVAQTERLVRAHKYSKGSTDEDGLTMIRFELEEIIQYLAIKQYQHVCANIDWHQSNHSSLELISELMVQRDDLLKVTG